MPDDAESANSAVFGHQSSEGGIVQIFRAPPRSHSPPCRAPAVFSFRSNADEADADADADTDADAADADGLMIVPSQSETSPARPPGIIRAHDCGEADDSTGGACFTIRAPPITGILLGACDLLARFRVINAPPEPCVLPAHLALCFFAIGCRPSNFVSAIFALGW